MDDSATALVAQAAQELRETARDHKRSAAAHRKSARVAMRRADFLERLIDLGIKTDTQEDTQ